MSEFHDVVIVGAGHAGAECAISLRKLGFSGSLALVGDEQELPYERPPLSKQYLGGEVSFESMHFRSAADWIDQAVALRPGSRVTAVNPREHTICCDDGRFVGYGQLVWAAGGYARRLSCPGADAGGLHAIRNRADIERILTELPSVEDVVVIGGGYIGLEAAAVLIKLGKRVTVLELQNRVLARVAGEPLSRFFEAVHREQGVDVRLGVGIAAIDVHEKRVRGVRLADGTFVPAQMVITGIGIAPAVEPLLAAGAEGNNGVRVDEFCRTSLTDIFAVGDCAEHRNPYANGNLVRLESVQNATGQAGVAARSILGMDLPYDAVPWFWSSQYDLRLQTVGLSLDHDEVVVRGDPAMRSFTLVYLKEGKVIALDCINSTRDYIQGRALIADRVVVDREQVADANVPLKSLLADALYSHMHLI